MKNLKEKPKEWFVLFSSQVTSQKEDLGKMDTLWSIAYADKYCQCWSLGLLPESIIEQPLVLSHLILSIMPLPSYQMNLSTLQFGCYGTALHFIIVWSCGHYYKV